MDFSYSNTLLNKFGSVSMTMLSKNENVNDYLSEYHHYEEYDPEKEYSKKPYEHDYGAIGVGSYTYVDSAYMLSKERERVGNDLPETEDLVYVVAQEKLPEEERKELAEFCQCAYHQKYWFNPYKYMICPCCVGCLETEDHYGQHVINETRKYMQSLKN